MTPRFRPSAVAVFALAVALAGCSGKGSAAGAALVRASAEKTFSSESSRVALEVTLSTGGTESTIRGDGAFALRDRRGRITLDLGALGGTFGGNNVESVLDGQWLYAKLPPGVLPGSRPWFKFDLAAAAQQVGVNLGSLGQLGQSDPTQVLEYLRGASDDTQELGRETVRGATTTHYRVTIDLRRAASSLPPDRQKVVDELVETLGTSRLPADVWIDDDGRARRVRFSVDIDRDGPGPPATVNLELFDFGVPVEVQVPPPDQVTDLTALFTPPPTPSGPP
jgi:hypothetical protein